MKSLILVVLVAWAALISPNLCATGLPVHQCEHGVLAEGPHADRCPDDPCGSVLVADRGYARTSLRFVTADALPAISPTSLAPPERLRWTDRLIDHAHRSPHSAPRCLPLLI